MREGAAMPPPPVGRAAAGSSANGDGKITRELVLAAALDIIDREGAGALSMRRLARSLGRDPMILYRHAPNKAALLERSRRDGPGAANGRRNRPGLGRPVAFRRPQLPRARPRPSTCGTAARHAAAGHTAGAAPPWHTPPARKRPRAADPGRLYRPRRTAHLPGPVRLPARARARRTPGGRRQSRRDRRPAAAGAAPAADRRVSPPAQSRPRAGEL